MDAPVGASSIRTSYACGAILFATDDLLVRGAVVIEYRMGVCAAQINFLKVERFLKNRA